MTDWVDANNFLNHYSLGYHTGADINLNRPHHDADAGRPAWACADGIVTFAQRIPSPSTWGRLIVIRHQHNGAAIYSRYAHLATMLVSAGDEVTRGQQIGTIGGAEFGLPNHLHFDISTSTILETDPKHWPGNNKQGVTDHYVDPKTFLALNSGISAPPATRVTAVDVSQHQGAIDFKRMMDRGTVACYVRGSIGGSGLDSRFAVNWTAVAQTPMKRGIYHLFRSDSTAEENLANIIRVVNQYGAGDMRVVIDVEPVTGLPVVDGDRVKQLLALFEDAFGYRALVYTGDWVYPHVSGDRSWFGTSLLWLAEYWSAPPPVGLYPDLPPGAILDSLLMHQWTSGYYIESEWGVESSGLDVNVAYDLERLLVEGDAPLPPPPPPPPPPPDIDLLPYMEPVAGGNGPLYELRRQDGSQERAQTQSDPDSNRFYIVKGTGGLGGKSEWEELAADDGWIWRGLDTSPGGGRYYRQFEEGRQLARWAPRRMRVGESWSGPGHYVQFFTKETCQPSEPNSGPATNRITLVAQYDRQTWNGVTVEDVVELTNGTETWWFARGLGMVAWASPWNSSAISELHAPGARPDNQREVIGCL